MGELFMRLLRALVLPLVSVSMVSGVCSLSARSAGSAKRVATRLVVCYFVSTLAACALGLAVVSVVRPGVGVSIDGAACDHAKRTSRAGVNDELPAATGASSSSTAAGSGAGAGASASPYGLSEAEAAAAAAADEDTMMVEKVEEDMSSSSSSSEAHRGALDSMLTTARAAVPANVVTAAAEGNILGVIAASLMFGAALAAAGPEKADPLVSVVNSLNHVIEVMVGWAIALMPPGVLSLVAGRVAGACDPVGTLAALGKYVVAVLLGLGIHGSLVLPGLYTLATAGCGCWFGGGGGGGAGGAGRQRRRRRRWWLPRGGSSSSGGSAGGTGSGVGRGSSASGRGGDVGGGGGGGDTDEEGGGGGGGGGGLLGGEGLTAAGVLKAGAPAMITAFATDSSSAALPVTRRCARAMGIPDALADFALPLGEEAQ